MSARGGTGTGWWASLPGRFVLRAVRVSRFIGYFAVRLVVANLVVAREIVTPGSNLSPGIVEIRLRTRTPTEVVLMALAVGLTPGTLTVAIRQDPPTLFVHGMHAEDPQTFRAELARLQDRLLPAVRPVRDIGDHPGERSGDDPGGRSGERSGDDPGERSGAAADRGRPEVDPS